MFSRGVFLLAPCNKSVDLLEARMLGDLLVCIAAGCMCLSVYVCVRVPGYRLHNAICLGSETSHSYFSAFAISETNDICKRMLDNDVFLFFYVYFDDTKHSLFSSD